MSTPLHTSGAAAAGTPGAARSGGMRAAAGLLPPTTFDLDDDGTLGGGGGAAGPRPAAATGAARSESPIRPLREQGAGAGHGSASKGAASSPFRAAAAPPGAGLGGASSRHKAGDDALRIRGAAGAGGGLGLDADASTSTSTENAAEEAVREADDLLRNPRFRAAEEWDLSRDASLALGEESVLLGSLDRSAVLPGQSASGLNATTANASSSSASTAGGADASRRLSSQAHSSARAALAGAAAAATAAAAMGAPGAHPAGDRKPARKSGVYADRFIPSRSVSNFDAALRQDDASLLAAASDVSGGGGGGGSGAGAGAGGSGASPQRASGAAALFQMLLRSELLGEDPVYPAPAASEERSPRLAGHPPGVVGAAGAAAGPAAAANPAATQLTPAPTPTATPGLHGGQAPPAPTPAAAPATPSVLRFRRPMDVTVLGAASIVSPEPVSSSPLSPLRPGSRHLLQSSPGGTPLSSRRRIPKHPFKVLDAPGLADDFYLNVVDWSAKNVVAVGLQSSVYLWSAHTARATRLDDLVNDDVACVSFTESGASLAVGTRLGRVLMYDVERCTLLRTFEEAHSGRVGCASWNGPVLATGSRDRRIRERDTRLPPSQALIRNLAAHRQEVCGLKYSFEGLTGPHRQLASGGNDNRLLVWDARRSDEPLFRFNDHIAAVKALAWSHQTGILASGGGTADRCIRVWSTLYGTSLSCLDTGSQVCGLVYSKTAPELVSTHGYSLNQIIVWRTPAPQAPLQKVATLQGHTMRVLYLALSPDGSTIVTGAGDESLRFWSLWPGRTVATSSGSLVMVGGAAGLR